MGSYSGRYPPTAVSWDIWSEFSWAKLYLAWENGVALRELADGGLVRNNAGIQLSKASSFLRNVVESGSHFASVFRGVVTSGGFVGKYGKIQLGKAVYFLKN